ncbi:hypothetical protein [Caudoviricetes sp.]|nr:hypothetical protein [Caudoviricetes sp.]UOF78392.1 hypothetical protein [Bacteriophage sp.]
MVSNVEARLETHEQVCAHRYEQINARLKRLEGIIIKAAGVMLCGMAGVIWASIVHKV